MPGLEKNILIVGTGPTAATCVYLLKKLALGGGSKALTQSNFNVSIWDKARNPGGRFTSYPRTLNHTSTDENDAANTQCSVDSGGQYITRGGGKVAPGGLTEEIYALLKDADILQPFGGNIDGHVGSSHVARGKRQL